MIYPGYGEFQEGNTLYPLTGSPTNTLLQDADPVLYWMLQYFSSSLNTYMGARWTQEVARAGLSQVIPSPVGMQFPKSPFPYLQDVGALFPILAVYWVDGSFLEKTISYNREQSIIEIAWVLPTLTMSQQEIIGPFTKAVKDIIENRSEHGADPNFMNNFDWGQACGFDWIQMGSWHEMQLPHSKTNLPFVSMVMQLKIRMRNMPIADQFAPMEEVDTTFNLAPSDGYVTPDTVFPDFVGTKNIL